MSTIARRIEEAFTPYEIEVRNKGRQAADKKYRDWYPRDRAIDPLEVVEFDDKDSGIFLVDEVSGLPYGRGFVTAGVDQHSEIPLGMSISELHRSSWSAVCALVNSILPLDLTSPDFELVKTEADYFGKLAIALFDNALYNHAKTIEITTHDLNVTPAWAKPKTPTEKRVVEGFNGRMQEEFFAKYVGYAGPKETKDFLKEGVRCANASVADFRKHLSKWAYDVYAHQPGSDGLTPCQRWHERMRLFKARLPVDVHRLRIAPTLRERVKLRPEGILFMGLIYQNEFLRRLKRNVGAKAEVEFRFDPRDLSLIYVLDPIACQLIVMPSANPQYTSGLTLYQHRLIRKLVRQKGRTNPSVPQMLVAREELRVLVDQLRHSKRLRERKRARQAGKVAGNCPASPNSKPTTENVIVTDLEGQVGDIDDVEMEADDEGWTVPEMI